MLDGGGLAADVVAVVVVLAAGLLIPAGIAKLRDPRAAGQALGLPRRAAASLVRAVGAGELVLAGLVLVVGGPVLAGVLAATYLGFTGVAMRQRSKGASCGCFGATSSPTTLGHVAMNLLAALAAGTGAAIGAAPALADLVAGAPLAGVPFLIGAAVAVAAAQITITTLPEVLAAARRTSVTLGNPTGTTGTAGGEA